MDYLLRGENNQLFGGEGKSRKATNTFGRFEYDLTVM